VAAGQTLYSISRIYDVPVSDIEKLNPEVKIDSIQINQVLKIPAIQKKEILQVQEKANPGFIIYKVKEKETVFSISKLFGISQDTLLNCNKLVAKEGLKAGQDIFIPVVTHILSQNIATTDSSSVHKIADSSVVQKNELIPVKPKINCDSIPSPLFEKNLQVALLLPLFSGGTSGSDAESNDESHNEEKIQFKESDEFSPIAANFIEFYQGILLALENLKNKGLQVDLYVFDTEKGSSKIEEILRNQNFKKCNLIIGPVYNEQVKLVSDYATRNKIFIISPISGNNKLLNGNSSLFQIVPSKSFEIDADLNLLKPDTSKNIIAIYRADSINPESYNDFKQALAQKFNKDTVFIKSIKVCNNDFSIIKTAIDSLHENIVISPVTDEIFVTNLLGNLESKLVDNRISVIGMKDWANFTGIDLNYYYDLQLTYNSPFYTDINDNYVTDFLKKYRLCFGTEPVRISKYGFNFAMLGYDICSYFINAYYMYGKDFIKYLPCIKNRTLVAPFNFIQVGSSDGYSNTFQHLVKYNRDYSIQIDTSSLSK
jgi:LysM repeat protein/ABC-type branched-subunit amino acid transport system substrate-binding protein